jgi:hypothetical protein
MNWSAKIVEKSELTADNMMTYKFTIIGGDEEKIVSSVTGEPDAIQQLVADVVTKFAQSWELAQALPEVDDVLAIIQDA